MKLFKKIFYAVVGTSLLLTSIGVQPVHAAAIEVNTPFDEDTDIPANRCSLREAIIAANTDTNYNGCNGGNGADTITFAGNYTITLNNEALPEVTSAITITGNGSNNTIIRAHADPNTADHQIFFVNTATGNLTLNNLSLRNGGRSGININGGCILANNNSSLTINNSIIENCYAQFGGGIRIYNNSTFVMENTTVRNNFASRDGGGIDSSYSSVTIIDSIITGNQSTNQGNNGAGGGISSFSDSRFVIVGSTISNNTMTSLIGGLGGGIYISSSIGTNAIINSVVTGNGSSQQSMTGGGIYLAGSHSITITNTIFSDNYAGIGGGVYNSSTGTLTLTNNTIFQNNSTTSGGGFYTIINSITHINNTVIANNTGGDCFRSSGITHARNSLIEDGLSCVNGTNINNQTGNPSLNVNLSPNSNSKLINAGDVTLLPTDIYDVNNNTDSSEVLPIDIAGNPRVQLGKVDIGAYEYVNNIVDNTNPTVVFTNLATTYTTGPDTFNVVFSEEVFDPIDNTNPEDVTNPANFLIVEAGIDKVFNTTSCVGGLAGDDTQATITDIIYNAGLFTATVNINGSLPTGTYRLFVCGTTSISDLAFNTLNGGTDFTFDFTVGTRTTTTPQTTLPPVTASSLPNTGFTPHKVTTLPDQPSELTYTALGDIWLEIPSQNIKSNIVGIPQSKDSTWDVTWLGNDIGWLNGTAFPTWNGNSVLTAHVTDSNGLPGPFANIKELVYGDQIIVHLFGHQYIFEVRDSRLARPQFTSFAFESMQEYSYLTLITCQGYIPFSDSYFFRRVVRTVLVDVK